jgi:hypothetical protein
LIASLETVTRLAESLSRPALTQRSALEAEAPTSFGATLLYYKWDAKSGAKVQELND